jgi:hypothetical protein
MLRLKVLQQVQILPPVTLLEYKVKRKTHPHPSARHVMTQYRRYLLAFKKSHGSTRGLILRGALIAEYLNCKADVIAEAK